jgi:AAHS family 4-hydroxybenzoate transporter-like MFS transporter
MASLNVGALLDAGAWSGYQKLLIAGTALTIILDGADNQLLPNALPVLMREWQLDRSDFATVLAVGPFGMMLGGAVGGWMGDRFGRRTALLLSVLSFAVLTLAIAWVTTPFMLGVLRFLAGLGLGGAMPNAAALAAEYVPRRHRPFAVTMTIVCIPLGGMLAAWVSGRILPDHGWRPLFMAGGLMPIVVAAVLFKVLPESPRYLARHRARWPELVRLLRRMGHRVPPDATFVETPDATSPLRRSATVRDLFAPAYRRDTLGLFLSFFFCLMVNYVAILLIPTTFRDAGFDQAAANDVLFVFNLGGVAGAVAGALLIQRLGSRVAMLGMAGLAVAVSLALAGVPLVAPASVLLMILIVVAGALLNGVQTTMYALAAHVYPTEIRGTGVGSAVAFGRIGNVVASYVGNGALDRGGNPLYFTSWAVMMGLVLASLAVVRRHIAPGGDVPGTRTYSPMPKRE